MEVARGEPGTSQQRITEAVPQAMASSGPLSSGAVLRSGHSTAQHSTAHDELSSSALGAVGLSLRDALCELVPATQAERDFRTYGARAGVAKVRDVNGWAPATDINGPQCLLGFPKDAVFAGMRPDCTADLGAEGGGRGTGALGALLHLAGTAFPDLGATAAAVGGLNLNVAGDAAAASTAPVHAGMVIAQPVAMQQQLLQHLVGEGQAQPGESDMEVNPPRPGQTAVPAQGSPVAGSSWLKSSPYDPMLTGIKVKGVLFNLAAR